MATLPPERGNAPIQPTPAWVGLTILATGLLLIGLAAYAGVWVVRDVLPGFTTRNWQKTNGTIVKTWLERTERARSGPYWLVRVQYSYRVGDGIFRSDRVGYNGGGLGGGGDEDYYRREMLRRYPANGPVDVYYNPADPQEACLETGVDYPRLAVLSVLMLGAAAGGMGLVAWGVRKARAAARLTMK
jgi:hypothetical protein